MTDKYANKVLPDGPLDAAILIVGESPGEEEARIGKPFIGRAGEELNRLLRAAGIDRTKCLLTNACPYLPKFRKDKDEFFFPGGAPGPEFMEGILDLAALIKQVQPKIIIAAGDYALWALTRERGITKWRGSVMECKLVKRFKVVPTFHPAYLFRGSMHHAPLVVWDLGKAKKEMAYPEIRRPERHFILPPQMADLTTGEAIKTVMEEQGVGQFRALGILKESYELRMAEYRLQVEGKIRYLLEEADHITFDYEYATADIPLCVSYTDSPHWAIVVDFTDEWAWSVHRRLQGCHKRKLGQNLMFDVTTGRRLGIEINGPFDDTMVGFHSCWGDIRKKDLGTIVSVYTDEPYYKEELKIWGNTRDFATLYTYNAKDSATTEESWRGIEDDMRMYQTRRGYNISMSIFESMAEATNFGILCDRERLLEMKSRLVREADEKEQAIWAALGEEFNSRSTQQVANLIYGRLGVKAGAKRSTDQATLMDIAINSKDATVKALITAVVEIRENRNLVSRSINEGIIDRDGRIRCSWNIAGTRNGRLSASDTYWGSGLSLQTQPDEAREFYIPDPGHAFVGFDQRQAEAFVVAYLCHDEELIEDMLNKVDIHSKLAADLPFGVTYEEIMRRKKIEDKVKERELAKKCRHGFNYQMGPFVFMATVNKEYLENGFGITRSEAKMLYEAYHSMSPNLKLWWKRVEAALRKGWMENAFGRRRRFLGQWGDELLRDATAFYPQATVADITTQIMAEVKRRLDKQVIWLIHAHDGAMSQVREEDVQLVGQTIQEVADSIRFRVEGEEVNIPIDLKVAHSGGRDSQGNPHSWRYMDTLKLAA